jgi:hypothetical protein
MSKIVNYTVENTNCGKIFFSHKKIDGKPSYDYTWKHIPSGKEGVRTIWCDSTRDVNALIARWNEIGNGEWVYIF